MSIKSMTAFPRNLEGRLIIISGGANGIGKATAQRLAAQGASLAISDLNATAGNALRDALQKDHPTQKFFFDALDVTSYQQVKEHVEKIAATDPSGLAGLVCAAGIAKPGPRMHETTIESYLQLMDVNVNGSAYYNHAVLATMVGQNATGVKVPEGGYSIVNIGSKASVDGMPGAAAYCATKHAVLGFSRANAKDYASEHIRTNVMCPGVILTDLLQSLIDSGQPELGIEHTLERVYMKRLGRPEEIAASIAFMIGPDSSYMTGHALVVDGVWSP